MFTEVIEVPADKTIIRAGQELDFSTLLLDGLLCRYKDLRDGSRQISELHVAGDFADLHSFTLKHLDHSVMALTRCRLAIAPHDRIKAVIRDHPHLARMFWFMTNLDAAIHREWVLSLGRRSAPSRTAHLFCELRLRLGVDRPGRRDRLCAQPHPDRPRRMPRPDLGARQPGAQAAARRRPRRVPRRPGDDPRSRRAGAGGRVRSGLSLSRTAAAVRRRAGG